MRNLPSPSLVWEGIEDLRGKRIGKEFAPVSLC